MKETSLNKKKIKVLVLWFKKMKKSRSEVTDWTAARPTPVDTGWTWSLWRFVAVGLMS